MLTITLTERCVAITRQGRQCRFKAIDEDGRCVHHTSNAKRRALSDVRAMTTMVTNAQRYLDRMEEMYPERDHSRSRMRVVTLELELSLLQETYDGLGDDTTIWATA